MTTTDLDKLTEIFNKVTIAESPKSEVLELCKIPDSLNIEQIKEHISKYLAPLLPFYSEEKCGLKIHSTYSEYYTAKSTDGIKIGAGNCAMDVITKNNEGIDTMCVIQDEKKRESNEKSLMQNFSVAGKNLDTLFKDKKDAEAVQFYGSGYLQKLQKAKDKYLLKELYILAFISTKKDVSLVCFKLNLENIKKISSGGFVKNFQGEKNIIINNFINPSYGNVKLYKSKKRMELRLNIDILKSEYAVKIYTIEGSEGLVAQSTEPPVQTPHSPPVCTEQSQTSQEESDTNQESPESESTPEE